MNNIEILYDHYKETVLEIKNQENKRNKLFVIILLHICILFLISFKAQSVCNIISDILMEQWKIGFYFSINIIQVFFMISMLYCVVRYYQINIHVDKTYPYIHKLEEKLSTQIGEKIEREGKNYISQYPKTQDFVYYSYKYIFPSLFIFALLYRLILNDTWNSPLIKIAEIIITIILIVLNVLYVIDMYKQEKNK